MKQESAIFDRSQTAAYIPFESPILRRAADSAPFDDEDAVMDGWLASLGSREFELILSRLADDQVGLMAMLEPTA